MSKAINLTMLTCCAFFLNACRTKLNPRDYVAYIQDTNNGFHKIVLIDNWQYDIQYKPKEYIQLQENANATDIKATDDDRINGTAWFNISFRRYKESVSALRYNLSSQEEYNKRIDYFLNRAANNIKLIYNRDTIKPSGYLFENNYNLTPQETMVVGFLLPAGEKKPSADMQLCYQDELFQNGIIKVTYTKEQLKNIPNLNF